MNKPIETQGDGNEIACSVPEPEPEYAEFYDASIMAMDGVFISGLGDVVIPVENFGAFPWDKLDMDDSNACTLSSGGSPLRNGQWTLCFWLTNTKGEIHPLMRQYRWVIPQNLVGFMNWCERRAKGELQSKLRSLIGA